MFNCEKPNKCENSDSELKKMASRKYGQHQLCDSVLETGTRHDSVFDQITKFIEFWKNGQKASFKIECENGEAVMNMSVSLKSSKKTRHSPSKVRRNRMRAEKYKQKKHELEVCGKQLLQEFHDDNDDIFDINSDINGNEELYILQHGNVSPSKSDENKEYRLSSTVNTCFSTPPSYDGRGATYDG